MKMVPELAALRSTRNVVRIPPELDIPITPRVRNLIDTSAFRRLSQISQLGLVSLVYPAANHTRFEHSLGVYRMALLFLDHLSQDEQFCEIVSHQDAERFLVAALLHDIGHWPFCHPIEDLALPGISSHEACASYYLQDNEIASLLREEWDIESEQVLKLLTDESQDPAGFVLQSLLSGPIDVDKMDYLMRDSLHAGVPYGRNFDQARLIQSLCLNERETGLAITDKGKTAAEMMVFARYVMFSEVYWHHTVRSATAMFQRAFYLLRQSLELDTLFHQSETIMKEHLKRVSKSEPSEKLLEGIFGDKRTLYKRIAQFSLFQEPDIYKSFARKPYPWLVECSSHLAVIVSEVLKQPISAEDILIDAPPVGLEVEFQIDVQMRGENRYCQLGDISPVVRTLAKEQFDDYVKRVRIFVHPRLKDDVLKLDGLKSLIADAVQRTN